jgi:hypothetical protein
MSQDRLEGLQQSCTTSHNVYGIIWAIHSHYLAVRKSPEAPCGCRKDGLSLPYSHFSPISNHSFCIPLFHLFNRLRTDILRSTTQTTCGTIKPGITAFPLSRDKKQSASLECAKFIRTNTIPGPTCQFAVLSDRFKGNIIKVQN